MTFGSHLVPKLTRRLSTRLTSGPSVHDPFSRHPFWFQTDCRGHVPWAYNTRYLDFLEAFVTARLRERSQRGSSGDWHRRMTMTAKLPRWLKAAKDRATILHHIARLRAFLPSTPVPHSS
jgi:hypothetical protein